MTLRQGKLPGVLDGAPLAVDGVFTENDISANRLVYRHTGTYSVKVAHSVEGNGEQ